jgi:hypothetical protein
MSIIAPGEGCIVQHQVQQQLHDSVQRFAGVIFYLSSSVSIVTHSVELFARKFLRA